MLYKKKQIKEKLTSHIEIEGPVEDLIIYLQGILEDCPDYNSIRIVDETWAGNFVIYGNRRESDKEYNRRVKKLKAAKTKREIAEKKAPESIRTS